MYSATVAQRSESTDRDPGFDSRVIGGFFSIRSTANLSYDVN